MDCPVCDSELDALDRRKDGFENVETFFCSVCEVEFHRYPKDNKKGVQMTGWYAYIPLSEFTRDAWLEIIHTERNIYGEEIPDRMPFNFHPFIKDDDEAIRVGKERAAEARERALAAQKEWQEKVG